MVKKSTLSKKLASYSAMVAAMLAVSHEADAQIIYTDLNPPVVLPNPIQFNATYDTSAYLDLNNDGIADFQFTATGQYNLISENSTVLVYSSTQLINVNGLHKDTVNRVGAYTGVIPAGVPNSAWTGSALLAKEHFYNIIFSSTNAHPSATNSGSFYYVTNKYLPLKFKNNGNTYYGWARLITIAADQLLIADYAYNSVPNDTITAGNTGCSTAPITPAININTDTLQSTTANKYQWYFADTLLVGDTLNYFVPSATGYYSVITIDSNGCLSQSTALYDSVKNISTGLPPSKTAGSLQDNQVSVYSYDKRLHIAFTDENYIGSPLKIYNILGQEIFSATLTTTQTEIDMSDFAAGTYIVEIAGKTTLAAKKIIIE